MHNSAAPKNGEKVGGLYLCQFSQGTIKIGMGVDVFARLVAHRAAGAVFGISIVRTDVIPCDIPRKAEKLLIDWCVKNSVTCNGREWFKGVDYEECLAAAKTAASAMMGPHLERRAGRDALQAIIDNFKRPATREASIYSDARRMMVENQIHSDVINALDYAHKVSEGIRANIRMGAPMPMWFDHLNCIEPWENELLHDDGHPSPEMLRAVADAILAIERHEVGAEVAHA
jgi:hypothetical protein